MYYASPGARLSWWIDAIEVDPLALAVHDADTGRTYRVPVTIQGGTPVFGQPVETEPQPLATKAEAWGKPGSDSHG
jgi:hypothetical protein